jgi:hypothetical protein
MPKQVLTGTLDEQCEFLYTLAQEKMNQGNFTGAVHALEEVAKYAPNYKDVGALLADAKQRKAAQRRLLIAGILGAMFFVGLGSFLQLSNDLYFIVLILLGAIVGYAIAVAVEGRRKT